MGPKYKKNKMPVHGFWPRAGCGPIFLGGDPRGVEPIFFPPSPNGGSSFSITDAPRLTTSTSPHPHHLLFSLLPPHARIRRQFYTSRTSYLARTSPNRGDYESVPSVDTSTVLHFQHFIIIIIIIKNTNSSTVLHFQHFILITY